MSSSATQTAFVSATECLPAVSPLSPLYIPQHVPYASTPEAMEQTQLLRRNGAIPDTAIYLEHEPVVTFGRETPDAHLAAVPQHVPTVPVPRGGLATYHGPGQIVGYLFIDLARRAENRPPDLHAYLRAIEEGLIAFLHAEYGLPAGLREGFTGVWTHGFGDAGFQPANESCSAQGSDVSQEQVTPSDQASAGWQPAPRVGRKLASIGVSCRRWVTAHGFALNIEPDMTAFRSIVPCGITDAEMTSVRRECELAGRIFEPKPVKELASRLHLHLAQSLSDAGWCRAENEEA